MLLALVRSLEKIQVEFVNVVCEHSCRLSLKKTPIFFSCPFFPLNFAPGHVLRTLPNCSFKGTIHTYTILTNSTHIHNLSVSLKPTFQDWRNSSLVI